MDLVSLIALCSLATSPSTDDLAHRIALANDADVFRVDDLTEGSAYDASTVQEAKGMTLALLERGHDVRVGLLLVPARKAVEEFGWSADQLFEPCANVSIGTELLELARKKSRNKSKLLSFYLFGNTTDGLDWAGHVLTFDSMGAIGDRKPSPVFHVAPPTLFALEPKPATTSKEKPKLKTKKASKTPTANPSANVRSTKKAKSSTQKSKHVPQPDVTSERLLTTDDLKRGSQ